jgi:hypothetical protein
MTTNPTPLEQARAELKGLSWCADMLHGPDRTLALLQAREVLARIRDLEAADAR